MARLFALFRTQNRFQDTIKPQHISNHAQLPSALLEEIRTHQQEFVRYISSQHESIQKIEKLTLVHLLMLHAPELRQLFDAVALTLRTEDHWVNHNVLVPYQNFLRKLILSFEQYQRVRVINHGWNSIVDQVGKFSCKEQMRQDPRLYFNFQVLCYCINMLNQMLGFLKRIPTLGRYYPKNVNKCFASFVKVASYQASLFYFAFKFIASELLLHHEDYLPDENQKKFLRDILQQHLQPINQQMKEIFLNKYYNPIESGIKVGLLQLDRLPDSSQKALYELKIFQHQKCQKSKKNRRFLREKIFGENEFDSQAFEQSLNWISSKEYQEKDLQELYEKENVNSLNRQKQSTMEKRRAVGDVLADISVN